MMMTSGLPTNLLHFHSKQTVPYHTKENRLTMNRIALARTLNRAAPLARAASDAAHPANHLPASIARRTRPMMHDVASPFSLLMREMDSMMPSLFSDNGAASGRLAVDIEENDASFVIRADVPGMKASDVKVQLSPDNVLSIDAERSSQTEEGEKGGKLWKVERTYGSYHRSFAVPDHVDVNAITADVKDGVLSLLLPKVEKAETHAVRMIPIGTADNAATE